MRKKFWKILRTVSLFVILVDTAFADIQNPSLQDLQFSLILPHKITTTDYWQCDAILQNCAYAEVIDDWRSFILPAVLSNPALITPSEWQENIKFSKNRNFSIRIDQAMIKRGVLSDLPELLTAKSDWRRAVLLRNYVYSHVPVGGHSDVPLPVTYNDFEELRNGKYPQLCSGYASIYLTLLNLFGIPGHSVYLLANTGNKNDSHTTSEVFLHSSWVLQDPTFNIHWEINGESLDTITLAMEFLRKIPHARTDGFPVIKHRDINSYYLSYKDLLANISIVDIDILASNHYQKSLENYPSDFNWFYYDAIQNFKFGEKNIFPSYNIEKWSFENQIPKDWCLANNKILVVDNEFLINDKAVLINTDDSNNAYQMTSRMTLDPGVYVLELNGALRGGMEIGVSVYNKSGFIIVSNFYSEKQNYFHHYLKFKIEKTQPIEFSIANFSFEGKPAIWKIKEILLGRVDYLAGNLPS